mmetsp:Transcript_35691/g.57338  ORF Transcript_35691/g.57338 Transcript_35691/m.57338 type:complete len:167 (+) Transcript_35691:221-721(+)
MILSFELANRLRMISLLGGISRCVPSKNILQGSLGRGVSAGPSRSSNSPASTTITTTTRFCSGNFGWSSFLPVVPKHDNDDVPRHRRNVKGFGRRKMSKMLDEMNSLKREKVRSMGTGPSSTTASIQWKGPLNVIKYPDPRLRTENEKITEFGKPLQELADEMFDV